MLWCFYFFHTSWIRIWQDWKPNHDFLPGSKSLPKTETNPKVLPYIRGVRILSCEYQVFVRTVSFSFWVRRTAEINVLCAGFCLAELRCSEAPVKVVYVGGDLPSSKTVCLPIFLGWIAYTNSQSLLANETWLILDSQLSHYSMSNQYMHHSSTDKMLIRVLNIVLLLFLGISPLPSKCVLVNKWGRNKEQKIAIMWKEFIYILHVNK